MGVNVLQIRRRKRSIVPRTTTLDEAARPVVRICFECLRESPLRYRFCGGCGARFSEAISPVEVAAAYIRSRTKDGTPVGDA